MKFRVLKLFVFVIVLCSATAKRYGGGSSRGSSSGSRGSSWGGISKPSRPSYTPVSRPSSTSFHNTRASTSDFLHSESGRPSRPAAPSFSSPPLHSSAPVHSSRPNSAPYPTGTSQSGFHHPINPSHSTNTHTPSAPPKPVIHDSHQQSSAGVSHSDPYSRQPAQNPHISSNAPYVPSGGYHPGGLPAAPNGISVPTVNNGHHSNSAPYPTNLPNHPHPNPSIGSSSYPTNSHPPPYSVNPPIHSQTYPNTHNSYNPTYHAPPPPPYGSSPSFGTPYHPSYGHQSPSYHAPPPPVYQPATQPFVPGRTVYVVPESHSRSSGPGIGSIIAGGVAAGATSAIVDHAISSIFRPSSNHVHTYPAAPAVGTPTNTVTHTTNNYYYGGGPGESNGNGNTGASQGSSSNGPVDQPTGQSVGQPTVNQAAQNGETQMQNPQANNAQPGGGTQANPGVVNAGNPNSSSGGPSSATNGAVSRTPEGQAENAPPAANVISDQDLMTFFEELFDKQDQNLNQYVELNLQKRVTGNNQGKVPDEAPEPLFVIKPELDALPTVRTLKALYDNYNRDGTQKEIMTPERRNEETAFLDEIVKTPVMSRTLNWLVDHKLVESDDYEQKELLRRMWFNNFDGTSSGFERIFLSEKFGDSGIVGMQNWIYFAHLEAQKNVNYLGYVEMTNLSGKGALLKLNYETEGFTIQNATIFVGTAPELELALYTVCFHARQNNWCPISLGGAKFFILTHSFRYYGKDLIDLGFPAF